MVVNKEMKLKDVYLYMYTNNIAGTMLIRIAF